MVAKKGSRGGTAGEDAEEELSRVPLQAILLADSFATLFRPITLERPKVLLPLVNAPMIEYTLAWLESAGVEEVFVFCCAHSKQVIDYLEKSNWLNRPNITVSTIESYNAMSAGDALRLIYERHVIRGDFVLVTGDTVSNMSLTQALKEHKERRKRDSNAVMTMIIKQSKPSPITHQSRLGTEELFMAIDPETKELLYYEDKADTVKGTLTLDKTMLLDRSYMTLHNDKQMSTATSSGSNSTASNSNFDGRKPLWKYVTVDNVRGAGGVVEWRCNFCNMKKKTTYTRVVSHLLKKGGGIKGCPKVSAQDTIEMMKLIDEAEKMLLVGVPKFVPLPPSTTFSSEVYKGFHDSSKKRKANEAGSTPLGPLSKAFNIQGRDTLNALIARFFYSSGLPFHLARSPYYAACFSYAANNNLAGYIPPGYNKLRQTLLQQEKAHVERLLQPIKSTWAEKGVSIVSDGWSDSQRRPLINFMAVTESGPMFLKAVDCSGVIKDKHFIFKLLCEVIKEVGPQNVVQIITDNARNCAAAGGLVEALYPHIVWTPCVVHTLNLALQNICAAKNVENNQETYELCSWISDVAADAMMIKNYIMNHGMRLAMFNTFSPLKLLSIAPTRFASVIVMLKRIKLLKRSLSEMVVSEEWASYREDDVEKAITVKLKVTDDRWWDKIDFILAFTAPIYDMIRVCDTDKPCLHLVYDMWDTMIEKVKKEIYKHERIEPQESSHFYDVVHAILVSRWNKNNTPLHCLAHSLNPRYYSDQWLNEDPTRVPPHKDNEVARERSKCLRKYFPDSTQRTTAVMEFANFSSMSAGFADSDAIEQRYALNPKSRWVMYGSSAPTLQGLALKILGQPSSSSCAERNWSTYSFVHSLRRNKLSTQRAEDLVFIHSNLRLLSRKTPEYLNGETRLWDIGGDDFGTFEDVGDLEIAELSLDEPELENVVFGEDENGDDLEDEEEEEDLA